MVFGKRRVVLVKKVHTQRVHLLIKLLTDFLLCTVVSLQLSFDDTFVSRSAVLHVKNAIYIRSYACTRRREANPALEGPRSVNNSQRQI